jgi:hypothetical protein
MPNSFFKKKEENVRDMVLMTNQRQTQLDYWQRIAYGSESSFREARTKREQRQRIHSSLRSKIDKMYIMYC